MTDPGFVHLRLRSEYSISDSIVRIDDAIDAAVADRQPALALTDSANLFGWVKFYKAAIARGVQPLCGIDCWVSNALDRDRPHRLLLIAADLPGYRNLCRLISRGWLENEYRGRAELLGDWLDPAHTRGIVALSGAGFGEVGQWLLAGDRSRAEEAALRLAGLFPDAFYLEVQRPGTPEGESCTR